MEAYPKAAMERAMKVQEVMLRAMAKKITWWQAAEIIGISDRHMRRCRERLRGVWLQRDCLTGGGDEPSPQAGAAGDGGAGLGAVSGAVFRSERAAFSREAAGTSTRSS